MTTHSAGLAVPQARRFSTRQFRRWQEVSLGDLLFAPALIILLAFEFFPIFDGLYTLLDNGIGKANQILKENAPQ